MRRWCRATTAEYRRLPLRAHTFLADVPLEDVWRVDLPGTDRPCTMEDVRRTMRAMAVARPPGLPVRALFGLRRLLGQVFGWDAPAAAPAEWSWRSRVAAADLERSSVPPGTLDGPFAVLYVHPGEAVSEIRNGTAHAFLVLAIEPAPAGHSLLFAIHVLPVGAWTRPYLALIRPFRHAIVYPSLLGRLHDAWAQGLGTIGRPGTPVNGA